MGSDQRSYFARYAARVRSVLKRLRTIRNTFLELTTGWTLLYNTAGFVTGYAEIVEWNKSDGPFIGGDGNRRSWIGIRFRPSTWGKRTQA